MAGVTVKGMAALEKKLGSVAAVRSQFIKPTMQEAVNFVLSQVPDYPPQSHEPMKFVSLRQMRWFFAALADGEIDVPYRRTGTLGRSITGAVNEGGIGVGGTIVGIIGTNVKYAPWVIAKEETPEGVGPQAEYHKGNWWLLEDVVSDSMPHVIQIFETRAGELLAK